MKRRPLGGGSRGLAPFILNLKAGHIECSTSCCSHSLCQRLGVIVSDTHWTGGWMCFRTGLMFWGKTVAPAVIRTPDHPAHSYSYPTRKHRCRKLWTTDSCKFHYYWHLSDIKLRFTKMLSLCMPWRHVCESGGVASLSLNLGTLPVLFVGGKEPLRHIQHEAGCNRSQF